jgi:hypothetical protein
MTDLVRVRVGNEEKSLGRAYAIANDLPILDEPARDRTGRVRKPTRIGGRPKKPRTTVDGAAAKKRGTTKTPSAEQAEGKAAATTVEPADSTTNPPSEGDLR